MMTMRESVARHVAAGIEGLDELSALVAQDIGRVPSRTALSSAKHDVKNPEKAREHRERNTRWYAANPERHRQNRARWTAENPAKKLLQQCRGKAKLRGRECSITAADIEEMLAPMVCSVTGLPLTLDHDGDSSRNPWAPSIDRIDCSRGYVAGNVRVVCVLYNLARNDFPDEAILVMAKALVAKTL